MIEINRIFKNYLILAFILVSITAIAQEKTEFKPTISWNITSQIWVRYSDLNRGSLINGEPTTSFTDVSVRRLRIPISSQITPRIYAYVVLGGNNFNFQDNVFKLKVLDIYAEYSFGKFLDIGFGKSGWRGLSRLNVRSYKSLMGLDSPLFSLNTVNKTDDLGRMFGIWFKGQAGNFDYRLTFNRPFAITDVPSGNVDFANNRPRIMTSSYIKYQFFEHESNKSAYATGTYMHSKKVFNIGAGFQYQEKAMSDGDALLTETNFYDINHFAIDTFLNLPLVNEDAITAYLGFYNYDFGKNYIRNVGGNNPTNGGGTDFNGAGVAFPLIGSGITLYTQFGYAFKETTILNKPVVIQPNIAIQSSNFDALASTMNVFDFTINFFLNNSHNNKLSLGYQHRPIFDDVTTQQKDYKGMAVIQYQISFK